MIYLDNGATTFHKPESVYRAVERALRTCANPGRGGYGAAMEASRVLYHCREEASKLFACEPEQVIFTNSCTHGLNIAIRTLVKPGSRVAVSGFEHNAVTRPLHALGAEIRVGGRKLFCWDDTLESFEAALKNADAAVFTHVSNVFGYILPIKEMAQLCRMRGIPFVIDAAQSAGTIDLDAADLGAEFIAMPGHKGLLGPQGTGLLLCTGRTPEPMLYGGTGSASIQQSMPEELPDRLEAGTMNVPGYAGLTQGIRHVREVGPDHIFRREHCQLKRCIQGLKKLGMQVFAGEQQAATVSFCPGMDCEEAAEVLARQGIAVRAGLHCAPLAHKSAGTLETGTVRVSFGHDAFDGQTDAFLRSATKLPSVSS